MAPELDTKEEVDEFLPEPSCRPQRMQHDAGFVAVANVGSDAVAAGDGGDDDADVDDGCDDDVDELVEHWDTSCNENHDCSEVVVPDQLTAVAARKSSSNAVFYDTVRGEAVVVLYPGHWDHRQ